MQIRRAWMVASFFLALLVLLTGCGAVGRSANGRTGAAGSDDQGVDADERETVFAVNVTPAIEGEIRDYIEVNGDVRTTTSIDVFANVAGEIVRLYSRVGRRVGSDELLAEIDPSRPGQNFALSPVRSPIAGTVTRIPVRVGSQVTLATPIAEISRTNELEIVVQLAERFISKVSVGLGAAIRLDAFPGEVFDATVTTLNPVVDPLTRTLEVILRLDAPDERIRSGMYAGVRIITQEKDDVVKVPAEVLVRRFGESFVFVVTEDDTAVRRPVVPGIEIDNVLEVVSGLTPDESVVYQGQALLADGARVRVINTVSPLEASIDQ